MGRMPVINFRFRSAVGGAEMFWHGLIDHSNVPGRRYAEFEELCRTVKKLKHMEGTEIRSGVALLCGFESEYAFSLQMQAEGAYYLEQMQAFHSAFTHYGVNVDIIDQEADLGKYRIVVAPAMYVRSQKASDQLHTFAQNGGIVLLTARSGVKDEHNNCIMQPLPAGYSDMTGCWVEEYDAVGNRKIPVIMDGQYYQGMRWCDIIRTESAETLAGLWGELLCREGGGNEKFLWEGMRLLYRNGRAARALPQAGGRDAASDGYSLRGESAGTCRSDGSRRQGEALHLSV